MSSPKLGGRHEVAGIDCTAWWRESHIFDRFARAIAGEPMKKRRSMTTGPKRHNAPKVTRRRKDPVPDASEEIALLKRKLNEALEQQTATSEVLQVISSSPGELEPVFNAMLENATRICGAKVGVLWLVEGDGFRSVAMHGLPPAHVEERQREPVIRPSPEDPLGRLARTKQVVHIADLREEEAYIKGFPPLRALVDVGGGRTLLVVPMLKEGELIGAIATARKRYQATQTLKVLEERPLNTSF